jgi:putative tryptophan/tyrosine transport system substrate-binding protein
MASYIGRRKFLATLLGGAAAWPLAARAQQGEKMRRIGVLAVQAKDDPDMQARHDAFRLGLQGFGWVEGRNVHIDYRFSEGVTPDVILAPGASTVGPLLQATRTVPIVFAIVGDPVGAVSSTAWRDRAGTSPDLWPLNMSLGGNGWSCSRRLRPA